MMASKSISAILWTLVSVNVITLIAGGLITWLGYAIPFRLKQFGLLPELVVVAGFASLIVACIGLCALNYSSYYALNVYGFFCTIFVLMLILGLPESWYKSNYFKNGSLPIDIIYYSLLFILFILLISAFRFSHHLKQKQMMLLLPILENSNLDDQDNNNYNKHLNNLCDSKTCACSSSLPKKRRLGNKTIIRIPIINKWLPKTFRIEHNNHEEMSFATFNNNNNIVDDKENNNLPELIGNTHYERINQTNSNHQNVCMNNLDLNSNLQQRRSIIPTTTTTNLCCSRKSLLKNQLFIDRLNQQSTQQERFNHSHHRHNNNHHHHHHHHHHRHRRHNLVKMNNNNNNNISCQCNSNCTYASVEPTFNQMSIATSSGAIDQSKTNSNLNLIAPLIHKGFYNNKPPQLINHNNSNNNQQVLVRAKSCTDDINEINSGKYVLSDCDDDDDVVANKTDNNGIISSCILNSKFNANLSSSSSKIMASKDDSAIEYRGKFRENDNFLNKTSEIINQLKDFNSYNSSTLGRNFSNNNNTLKCNCRLGNQLNSLNSSGKLIETSNKSFDDKNSLKLHKMNDISNDFCKSPYNTTLSFYAQPSSSLLNRGYNSNNFVNNASYSDAKSFGKYKSKSNVGASSVVAMTAAVAAALFGGVADTSSSFQPSGSGGVGFGGSAGGFEDGCSGGLDGDGIMGDFDDTNIIQTTDQTHLMANSTIDGCQFETSHHHQHQHHRFNNNNNQSMLDASMLNDNQYQYHHNHSNVFHQAVLDFTPLLEFKK